MRAHRAGVGGALAAVVLAGCGSSDPSPPPTSASASEGVVRAWTDAVRERRYARAAELFALPSRIQNGVTVRATRRSHIDIFNRSLSCGAVLKSTAPQDDGRLLATFRLVKGPGGTNCSGLAQVRFRIRGGRITEWSRVDTAPPAGSTLT